MITKPQLVCDACERPIDPKTPGTISFVPIRGGLFLHLNDAEAGLVEQRIVDKVHLCGQECFLAYTQKIIGKAREAAAKVKADAEAAAAKAKQPPAATS